MFTIQFTRTVSGRCGSEKRLNSCEIDETHPLIQMEYAKETVRYMRRLLLFKTKDSAMIAFPGLSYLIPEYRKLICIMAEKYPVCGVSWDTNQDGVLSETDVLRFTDLAANHALDKSVTDDQFVDWFNELLRKKRPPVKLKAVS